MNIKRSYATSVTLEKDEGKKVSLCGWISRARNLGGLIFADLRDRSGIIQCVFDQTVNAELFDAACALRSEYTVKIEGVVRKRSNVNPKIPTGDIEVVADFLEIYSPAETTPFEINDDVNVNEALRLKYRYLDLRRPSLQSALAIRHRVMQCTRSYFAENNFFEIETPILTKSTPEGARDYLVPSRVHPGQFYALPQSPQQYKQLLMVAGFDRYMQIARCFRDEDLRYDRQPEFTQIDLEMSFVDVDDVIEVNEGFIKRVFKEIKGIDVSLPIPRMSYAEAMNRYGSDKPDTRFGFELHDVTELTKNCGFAAFEGNSQNGGYTGYIKIDDAADKLTRKDIDVLTEFVKTYKVKGLAWLKNNADGISGPFIKFMKPEIMDAILKEADVKTNDVMFFISDADVETAQNALGVLRIEVAKRLNRIPQDKFNFLWVVDFPMFEYGVDDETGETRLFAKHHPFTAPVNEDIDKFETAPETMRAKAYDIVLNGTELGGGSIRIHNSDVQQKMFNALGISNEDAELRFGHMLKAFKYGAPPHGGLAYGLDRLVMWLAGTENIRDVIAFPKVQNASELMTECPSTVDAYQLRTLSIAIDIPEK